MAGTLTITKGGTTLSLMASPYEYEGTLDLGGVLREWEADYGADSPAPRFGRTKTAAPRLVPFPVLVTGTDADDLASRVSALIALLPDDDTTSTITVAGNSSAYSATLTARRVEGMVEKPVTPEEYHQHRSLVTFTLACDPYLQSATETLHNAAAVTLPAVASLAAQTGDAPSPYGLLFDFAALECRYLFAGRYPDESATIATFARELVGATWVDTSGTGAAASDDAGYGTAIGGNEVWATEGSCYTDVDVTDFEPGEYLAVAKCKTADAADPGTLAIAGNEAVTLTSTALYLQPLGTVYLPASAVRGSAVSTVRLTLTGAGTGDAASVNALFFIPTSFGGLIGWRRAAGHAHELRWEDDMVYADDVGALGDAFGSRQIVGKGGVLVVLAEQATPAAGTACALAVTAAPRWEQMPSPSPSPTVVYLGDSITAQASDSTHNYAKGYSTWAQITSRHRLGVLNISGHGGERLDELEAYLSSEVIAYTPGWCVVQGGSNDIGEARTYEQIIASLQSIHGTLRAAGIRTIACQIPPSDSWNSTLLDLMDSVNAWLVSYAAANEGTEVCAWTADFSDVDRYAYSGYTSDGTHPTANGAAALGAVLSDVITANVARSDDRIFPPYVALSQMLANPLILGDSSGVATGVTVAAPSGGAVSNSKVARTDGFGEWQQVNVTSNPTPADLIVTQSISSGFSEGEVYRAAIEFEIDAGATIYDATKGRILCAPSYDNRTDNFNPTAAADQTANLSSGVFVTPEYTVPSGATNLQVQFVGKVLGIVRVGRMALSRIS